MKRALRSLLRSPLLFGTAVLLLALGIGATTALFSVANTVLIEPLPYKQPDRLVRIWTELTARGIAHFPESPPNLEDFRAQATLFEGIAGVTTVGGTFIRAGAEPRQLQVGNASWDFLAVLGVEPLIGRHFNAIDGTFSEADVAPGAQFPANTFAAPRVAMISHALWQNDFGGSADALGQRFSLNGVDVEVVGVLPAGFRLHMAPIAGVASDVQVWTPLRVDLAATPRNNVFLNVVGRLREGVSYEQATTEIDAIAERMHDAYPIMRQAGARKWLRPYVEDVVADVRSSVWALFAGAAFVLLIACANVASLLLMRAAGRGREFAVRAALGADRMRLMRQSLAETAVLAALGGIAGLIVAHVGLALLLQSAPANIARLDAVRIDGPALAFALLVSISVMALAGLLPAWQGARGAAAASLRDRSAAALRGGRRLHSLLVAFEVALSVVLLVGAGLMVRNFDAINRTDPGFVADDVLSFQVNLPVQRYPDFAQRREFIYAFQQRLARLPGIEQAGATTPLPLTGRPFNGRYANQAPAGDDTAYRQANYRIVLPGYFETMRTPLLAGRHLSRDDEVSARRVVVVDDVMATAAWPDDSPLGKQVWLRLNQPDPIAFEVVGVVRRQLQDNLHETPRETVYFTAGGAGLAGANDWVVRADGNPDALLASIRRALAAMDPTLPLANVQPMSGYLDAATQRARFALQLIGAFAAVALLIALVGLYVAIQSLVTQRRAEIGLRMSVGARARDVFRHFVGRGLLLASIGIAVGLVAATAFAQAMRGFLVKVSPTDWVTYAVIAFLFLAIALLASAVPALRAARISPTAALREN